MTSATRLAKVELDLSPTQLVVRWLAEAHAHDDFTAYVAALSGQDRPELPFDRLAHEAEEHARARLKGRPRDDIQAGVGKAVLAAVFRVHLVLRINVIAQDFLDHEALYLAALSSQFALAMSAPEKMEPVGEKQTRILEVLFVRIDELHALEQARAVVEERYLDGAEALFPSGIRAWERQRAASEQMTVLVDRLAELDGLPRPEPDEVAFEARVGQLVADHVDPARSRAYEQLGDTTRAMELAVSWLRPKLVGGYG